MEPISFTPTKTAQITDNKKAIPVTWLEVSILILPIIIVETSPIAPARIASHPKGMKDNAPLNSDFLYAKPIQRNPRENKSPPN